MKNLLSLLIALAINANLQAQEFIINVSVKEETKDATLFLRYFTPDGPFQESAKPINGQFMIKGKMPAKLTVAKLYILHTGEKEPTFENSGEVWLEPVSITIATEKKTLGSKLPGLTGSGMFW